MATRILATLALVVTLCACGGGGDSPPQQAVAASSACRTSILLDGDSTMWGYAPGGGGARAETYPERELQRLMDRHFGAGTITVRTGAATGTTSTDALTQPRDADIVLYNSGINDVAYGHAPQTYWANMRELAKVPGAVFVTPLPVATATTDYADIMRAVSVEASVPLIDARAYAESRADWWQIATDGVHPNSDGYRDVVDHVLAPVIIPLVVARCR